MPRQPNILFIVFDDLCDSIHGIAGNKAAKMPNLMALAQRGTRFTNAHCPSPLCSPARASFLTGLYPHTSTYYAHRKQIRKWDDVPALRDANTFMKHFRNQGYEVFGTGKVFHNGHERWTDWDREDGTRCFGEPPSWSPYPWDGREETCHEWNEVELPWLPGMGSDVLYSRLSHKPFGPDAPAENPGWISHGQPFHYASPENRDALPDEKSAAYLCNLLQQDHDAPFMMCFGVNRPHTPLVVPDEYFDRFPLKTIELPPILEGDLDDCIASICDDQNPDINTGKWHRMKHDIVTSHDPANGIRKWIQAYLACANFADEQVGKVLQALADSQYSENTIVVVTSDHGYHFGQKQILFKNTLWEEATRIPLIFAGPDISEGATCAQPVSTVDLYPTLCDMAGLPHDPHPHLPLDGQSLMPVLANANTPLPRDFALTALANADQLRPEDRPAATDQHFSIRTERYRYIFARNGDAELYDHDTDPYEWHNLAWQPEHAQARDEMHRQLCKAVAINRDIISSC